MRQIFIFATILLSTITSAPAQIKAGKINGVLNDNKNKPLEAGTASLLKASDSSVVKLTISDKSGKFGFENLPNGKYLVAVSAIANAKSFSETIEISDANREIILKPITLTPASKSMATVIVNSTKPLIEQKAGKTVINVEASPTNIGLNVLDLLQKSPGVTVDNDGNISLKGKPGVMILIDGKPTYMSGPDLAAYLKNMQSTSLSQIEIMTNPPAKYDAAGNSGIINIKTKKGVVNGMNGSANIGYNARDYGSLNSGLNLNYRKDKLNVFGSYYGGSYEGYNKLSIKRRFYQSDKTTISSVAEQLTMTHYKGNYNGGKAGLDYYFSKKDVAGFVVNANFNDNSQDAFGDSYIRDNAGKVLYKLSSLGENGRTSTNWSSNFNYKHTFDSTGRELTADVDYIYYNNKSNNKLTTESFDADNIKNGNDIILKGSIPSVINIYSAKADYVHPFNKGLKLEAGIKSSYVNTDNTVDYLRNSGAGFTADNRSNHFVYDENINAVYTILTKTLKKWEVTGGLRLENTIAKGHQVKNDSSFKRDYTNLFPNVGVAYNASDRNQFHVSYSRRISRPDYQALNPFIFFLDSLTYEQGNPYLQPQFTNNVELSHTFKKFLTTTLNYTQTNDIITELLKQDTQKRATFLTRENFSSMKQYGLAVMVNLPLAKWWNINVYTNVYNNRYNGIYQNDVVNIQYTSFSGNITNRITFGKGWAGELSGWYNSKMLHGLLQAKGMGALNAGFTKQVLKTKGTVRFGADDIFNTRQFTGLVKYSDVNVNVANRRVSRQYNINFSYRFGKKGVQEARRKNSGASDEQSRVKSGD
ncbi:MAG: TonB-dependent receptor [Ginsengibacter sp.]